ncbi:MAG: DUF58 domain-containing protein [Actinomycetota bacterium]
MPRPTKRFAALVGGSVLLFLIGTNVQSGWLFVLSALLLGAALSGLVLPWWMVRDIRVTRSAPSEATQGRPVRVRLDVENGGRGMRYFVELEDAHLASTRLFVASIAPTERVTLDASRIAARRGIQSVSDVVVTSGAPFGVGRVRRRLSVESTTTVLPAWVRLHAPPVAAPASSTEHAIASRPRRGTGPEYLGIREWRPGDNMRHVHWASTARTGAVMVREFEEEQRPRLVIVIDTLGDIGEEHTPLDRCCAVAASVALAALRQQTSVRLVAAASGRLTMLDDADPHRVLRWLAELERGGQLTLDAVLHQLQPRLRDAGAVFVAAPTWRANDAQRLVAPASALRSAVAEAEIVLVDASAFGGTPSAPLLDPRGVDRLTAGLISSGIATARLGPDEDLADALDRRPSWAS